MSEKDRVILYSFMIILGNIMGIILAKQSITIKRLTRENKSLHETIEDYEWQIKQVPYVIESWCKGE